VFKRSVAGRLALLGEYNRSDALLGPSVTLFPHGDKQPMGAVGDCRDGMTERDVGERAEGGGGFGGLEVLQCYKPHRTERFARSGCYKGATAVLRALQRRGIGRRTEPWFDPCDDQRHGKYFGIVVAHRDVLSLTKTEAMLTRNMTIADRIGANCPLKSNPTLTHQNL